jgi:protein-tyrosine phosphatase
MSNQLTYNFGPAAPFEKLVYGAARPGYGSSHVTPVEVHAWCEFMQAHSVKAVCCLLTSEQLIDYEDLLGYYTRTFGAMYVCWVPIPDFSLVTDEGLNGQIIPFLVQNTEHSLSTVVHCSAGSGRTGHVLALWLSYRYGLDCASAIHAVRNVPNTNRNPREAVTTKSEHQKLEHLFSVCRSSHH